MSKENLSDLKTFLQPFPKDVRLRALWLREFVWDLYPTANELIYDNYNAVAFGWSPTLRVTHTFCSIAIGRSSHNVHFGFYWGAKISDPENLLIGNGNQYRYLLVNDIDLFPKAYVKKLVKDAYAYSMSLIKDPKEIEKGMTVTKSVSQAKRKQKSTGKSQQQ
jgi:hypothetical protein